VGAHDTSGSSQYLMYRDEAANPPAIVCVVGKTELRYQLRAIDDLHTMLKKQGDWMPLGSADEQKPAAEGTVEAWVVRPRIPSAAGMAPRKDSAGVSACTCRPCSRRSASPRSSTTPRTIGCARPSRTRDNCYWWGLSHAASAASAVSRRRPASSAGAVRRDRLPGSSAGPTPRMNLDQWTFSIEGEIDEPKRWTWKEFLALPQRRSPRTSTA